MNNTVKGVKGAQSIPLEERFWAAVDKLPGEHACWIWTRSKDQNGYGIIFYNGRKHRATRVSLMLAGTPVRDDLFACHKCDNPKCVRPSHLFIGSNRDNMLDSVRKGRSRGNPRKTPECKKCGRLIAGENYLVCGKKYSKCRHCQNEAQKSWKRRAKARAALKVGVTG